MKPNRLSVQTVSIPRAPATESWWLGKSREELNEAAKQEQIRMSNGPGHRWVSGATFQGAATKSTGKFIEE